MLLSVALLIVVLGAAVTFLVWNRRSPEPKRSLSSLVKQWIALRLIAWHGARQRSYLEIDTQDICRVQEKILLQRLQQHQDTEYGRLQQFCDIKDSHTFRKRHPLTQYGHYREYILSVSKGQGNVLLPGRPDTLPTTSGTSGTCAMLLGTIAAAKEFFLQGTAVCWNAIFTSYPELYGMQKMARFSFSQPKRLSEAGLLIGPATTIPAAAYARHVYSTPATASEITSKPEALYVQLLFALRDRSLGILEATSTWSISEAFVLLRKEWNAMAEDVCIGRINPHLALPDSVRQQLDALLKPDAHRAWELRVEFEKGFQGIAKRLWPRLHAVIAGDSGGSPLDGDNLRDIYCRGVPVYSPMYAAAEGLIGVNLWPEKSERHYLLCPRSMFCEFIPMGVCEEAQPLTLAMHEVKENELYELVITNHAGLYRYRIGDVVKVVGFHNQCPVVEFIFRQSQMLNIRGEKISEDMFYSSLRHAVKLWHGASLVDYCTADSRILGPFSGGLDPHYEIFVELKGVRNLSQDQRYKLDQCLQEDIPMYKALRLRGSIGHAGVHLVQSGAFAQLRYFIGSEAVYDRLQMPRVLKRKELAEFMQRQIVS
ncbi:GH3 domain-containing protein isoform X2 [Ambystoma mexicanum]|uniref:GH3 domain-containing protein isoform X2 n=1 Tax=Ambystoma mexicanum TaxID=8296 RepID=UPI0037E7DD4F